MEKIFFFILLIQAVTVFNPGYLKAENREKVQIEYTPDKLSSFVGYLIHNNEYYRAYTELKRLDSYYPDYITPLAYRITESYILYKSGKYDDIIEHHGKRIDAGEISCAADIFIIDSIIRKGDFKNDLLKETLSDTECLLKEDAEYIRKRRVYSSVIESFYNKNESHTLYDGYDDAYRYAAELSGERKSPLAAALWGVIPGMGYVYAGETGTGITAFIVIAIGSAVTWGAHINDVEPLAAVSGTATFFMYAGSIAGGYMETVKYNRSLESRLVLRLDKDFMLEKDLDAIYFKLGIESNVR